MAVYLDHNATTPLDPRVLEAMLPYLSGPYANASSLHRYGRAARDGVEQARAQLAVLLGCQAQEIIWTSGGTEANNLAIKGVTALGAPSRVLYGSTEHPAVMEAAESLRGGAWGIEAIAVDADGVIDWPRFAQQLTAAPLRLVSLMRANNETGVIQDVQRAAALVHAQRAWLHVDAVQAAGKLPLDFVALQADLMSVSSHKIHGPKGIGALVLGADVELQPLHHGGAQERGLRGGTENVAAIVGFGAAAELAVQELEVRSRHSRILRDRLEAGLRELRGICIFGAGAERLPNTLQFAVDGYDGEALLMQLDRKGFAVSSGSACASGSGEPSHVLLAMGLSREIAKGAIRVSFGPANTQADVDQFLAALSAFTPARAMNGRMIYLDHAATTPLDRRVLEAMLPWLDADSHYGNPASDHALGRQARAAVETARAEVAALIGAGTDEIIWTSGATEANNLAIKGALEFRGHRDAHLVTSRIEHKAVLDTARYLETQGLRVTYLTPAADGIVGVEQVLAALRTDTALVSLMWVNNETGAINPIEALAVELRARGVLLHVDAVQAVGKLPIDLGKTPIDLLSLSAHKLYGPKGVGALFVRKRPRARLSPQIHGGGHEQGMRSGTLATHQLVGFGAACRIARAEMSAEQERLRELRDQLQQRLQALPDVLLNGPQDVRAPGLLNLSFAGIDGEALRALLPQLMLSSGSACSSATREPSYVLRALGRDDQLAGASLRLSLGRMTSVDEIDAAAEQIIIAVRFLRAIAASGAAASSATALPLAGDDNVYGYANPVWQRFIAPRHGGWLAAAGVLEAEASDAATRARLRLQVQLQNDQIVEARFQALGCPVLIAVGDWLAEQLQAQTLAEVRRIDAAAIRAALEIPEDKSHCSLVGEDVLYALLRSSGGSHEH